MTGVVWYAARSAGIVAYLLLSASVVLGLLMSTRASLGWPRFAVEDVHRFIAKLTGVFIVIHGGALLLDQVVPFSLAAGARSLHVLVSAVRRRARHRLRRVAGCDRDHERLARQDLRGFGGKELFLKFY